MAAEETHLLLALDEERKSSRIRASRVGCAQLI